jgi:putative ABC transport system permease protein
MVRIAVRRLIREPVFSIVAVLSLALAIALNTTMYSVLDAMIRPPVDMRAPEQLYDITYWGGYRRPVDAQTFDRVVQSAAQDVGSLSPRGRLSFRAPVAYGEIVREADYMVVSQEYFDVIGISPLQGRLFAPGEDALETGPVIVSDAIAAELFPNRSPLGATIHVDGVARVVVGVVGRGANFPKANLGLWLLSSPSPWQDSRMRTAAVFRLRDGVSVAQAEERLAAAAAQLAVAAGESPGDTRFRLEHAVEHQFQFRKFHLALIGAVLAVLLVACANLANMQLARGISRGRELALRAALGASRRDIAGQLLLESAILAGVGLALGLLLTVWGIHALSALIPPSIGDYVVEPRTNWRVFAFGLVASALCVVLIGLYPALRASRADPNALLKAGAGTGASKRNRQRYGVLIAVELGLSLAVLSAAALMLRMAWRVEQVRPPYDPTPLAISWLLIDPSGRTPGSSVSAELANIVSHARALSDAADATASFRRSVVHDAVTVDDPGRGTREIPAPRLSYEVVTPSYFRTYRLPIVEGRDFQEGESDVPAVIVSRRVARAYWPNSSPIGAMIKLGEARSNVPWVRVVGIVGEASRVDPRSTAADSQRVVGGLGGIFYLPNATDTATGSVRGIHLVVRAREHPAMMPSTIRLGLRNLPGMRVGMGQTMAEALRLTQARSRAHFIAAIFATFTAAAVGLACLGVYGIVSHSIAERRRELGVRIALGATAGNVIHSVLREGNAIALAGVALGLLLTKYGVPLLAAFSLEDDQYDASLFALLAAALFIVAVTAALVPALRATRIDPVESLRSE